MVFEISKFPYKITVHFLVASHFSHNVDQHHQPYPFPCTRIDHVRIFILTSALGQLFFIVARVTLGHWTISHQALNAFLSRLEEIGMISSRYKTVLNMTRMKGTAKTFEATNAKCHFVSCPHFVYLPTFEHSIYRALSCACRKIACLVIWCWDALTTALERKPCSVWSAPRQNKSVNQSLIMKNK